jgi:hypothetical protein
MTAEHIRALNGIGFDWGTSKTDSAGLSWYVRFQQLLEFKTQFGHCLVSQRYSANPKLGKWVSNQRCNYKLYQDGKPSPMSEERIQEFDSIGFDWGPSKNNWASPVWRVRFQQLLEFKAKFGHCNVPSKYSANTKLGKWVSTQHSNYRFHQKGKRSLMTAAHIRALDGIGFDWG